MNISENQIFTTNYKGFLIEIFLTDNDYAFVIRKEEFEDIEKGFTSSKEALIKAKRLIDAGELTPEELDELEHQEFWNHPDRARFDEKARRLFGKNNENNKN